MIRKTKMLMWLCELYDIQAISYKDQDCVNHIQYFRKRPGNTITVLEKCDKLVKNIDRYHIQVGTVYDPSNQGLGYPPYEDMDTGIGPLDSSDGPYWSDYLNLDPIGCQGIPYILSLGQVSTNYPVVPS